MYWNIRARHTQSLSSDLSTEAPKIVQDVLLHGDDFLEDNGLFGTTGRTQPTADARMVDENPVGVDLNGVRGTDFSAFSTGYAGLGTPRLPADRLKNRSHVVILQNRFVVAHPQAAAVAAEANLKIVLMLLFGDALDDRLEFRPCTDRNQSKVSAPVQLGLALLHRGVPRDPSGNHVPAGFPQHDAPQVAGEVGTVEPVPADASVHQDSIAGILNRAAHQVDGYDHILSITLVADVLVDGNNVGLRVSTLAFESEQTP
jgi:hypothetical protein